MTNVGSDGNPMGIRIPLRSSPPRPRTRRFMMTHTDYSFSPGRRFFDEMDRDHDGKLKLDDLKVRALERPLFMTVFGQLTNARVDHFF